MFEEFPGVFKDELGRYTSEEANIEASPTCGSRLPGYRRPPGEGDRRRPVQTRVTQLKGGGVLVRYARGSPMSVLTMGVSTTGESGVTFPTRILNPDFYWGISPVKSKSGLMLTLSSSMFDFFMKTLANPEK